MPLLARSRQSRARGRLGTPATAAPQRARNSALPWDSRSINSAISLSLTTITASFAKLMPDLGPLRLLLEMALLAIRETVALQQALSSTAHMELQLTAPATCSSPMQATTQLER